MDLTRLELTDEDDTCIIPSAWKRSDKNTPADNLRKWFIEDMEKYQYLNFNISMKPRNIFRVMTYNVHYWSDPFGKEVNHKDVVKLIRTYNPDVFGLQEVLIPGDRESDSYSSSGDTIKNTFAPFIRDGYNLTTCRASKVMSRGKTSFGNILGSKKAIKTSNITLPSSRNNESRCAIISEMEPFSGHKMVVCVIHLDDSDPSGETRRLQLSLALKHLEENYPDIPKMLMGDFNCLRRGDYEHYYEEDVGEWLNNNSPGGIDYDTTKMIEKNGYRDVFMGNCGYTVWSGRKVDYIFVKDFTFKIIDTHVVYSSVSDHLPLMIDFQI